ncbi:tetratricopeptide repeat protein [Tundrisphaera sp. TA3]|uniref:tetratricopeptide repeat protein n=1 Tax=Tundrisphaera sp. TA3 TaxID=3435775 RepID=UPI003EC01174
MSLRRSRLLLAPAATSAFTLMALSVALGDVVTLNPDATTKGVGGAVRGVVQAESSTVVEVKLGNTVTKVPTNEVASITYDGHPASLDQANDKLAANDLAAAAELFKKAAGEASTKPFIAEDALFSQARTVAEMALTDTSKAEEAVALLDAFTRAHKSGRHAAPALEALARLQIAQEDYAGVEKTLSQLGQFPKGEDRAAIFKVKVFAKKGQLDQAIAELDKIIAAAPEKSEKRRDALLTKAESLAAQKKYAEAESTVRAVIKDAPTEDAATQAAAYNTLGDCLRAAGKPKEALYAYLHTDLLFGKAKNEHARALSQISQLWRVLKREDRAEEAKERLKQEYPRSTYANAMK